MAAIGLYLGSLLVLRYNLADIFTGSRSELWVGYLTLIISGMMLAEILRRFRNPIAARWRVPFLATFVLSALVAFQYSPILFQKIGWHMPLAAVATGGGEAILRPGWDGHYRTIANLNGSSIEMLVDTGASLVLLRHEDAIAANIDLANLQFNLPVTTAGSQAFVAPIVFEAITVGGVTLHNIRGAVATPGLLHTSLLGMSFLQKLSETVIRGDRMILRQ